MNAALYATIWVALALFAAGEAGKRALVRGVPAAGLAWRAWTLGGVLCAAHMALALGFRHGWSQAAARADIARKTAEVFGLDWGGGLYLNYLFVAAWIGEACWWKISPTAYARRPRWSAWVLRAFALIMITSGAVVFASPIGRIAGAPLVAALLWTWRPRGLQGLGTRRSKRTTRSGEPEYE